MNRWLLFVLLVGLLFATVVPVSAAGNGPRSNFTFVGRITEIGDGTVTVHVLRGNKLAQSKIEQNLAVTVTDATRLLFNDGIVTVSIPLADLKIGDPVSVHGTLLGENWIASRITVGAKLIHFP